MNSRDACFYSDDIETAWSRLKYLLYQSMDMQRNNNIYLAGHPWNTTSFE